MSVVINHIVVHCHNKEASASFLADILGLPEPTTFHRFQVVRLDNGATLDFLDSPDNEIVWEHFAFLVDESDFDAILSRIKMRNVQFWAEPFGSLYFKDPNNHLIEILTVPYGGERLAAKYVA
jgi:catechol 2,3-dioxygenase-like lactoylglutathione lyase family enzyme